MIKRIKYVSRHARRLTQSDIDAIAEVSASKNAKAGITGVFMSTGELFFQVLEGPAEAIDALIVKIISDDRHTDVLVLGAPELSERRLFGQWSMRKFQPAYESSDRLAPLHALVKIIADAQRQNVELSSIIERGIWRELNG
ncbi:MAG: BLUF domain-containing protein [Myxococcales bacterium]|nr:BLUF domain-containing protein [Myxococcales bacterium]